MEDSNQKDDGSFPDLIFITKMYPDAHISNVYVRTHVGWSSDEIRYSDLHLGRALHKLVRQIASKPFAVRNAVLRLKVRINFLVTLVLSILVLFW